MVSPTTDRRLGLVGNTAFKAPVTVLATSNITQSGQQTIDGVAVLASNASGVADRVLCTGMTDATKNGIWDVSTAAWTRSKDADGNYDLTQGSVVYVTQGTTNGGSYWKVTNSGLITIGTTALTWARAFSSDLNFAQFLAAGTGAAARGAQDKMRDVVSVKDYGAKGDGVTNDTVAMQAAHATGNLIYYPAGTYIFSNITISNGGGIVGDGKSKSILSSTDVSVADAITVSGAAARGAVFRDFGMFCPALKTSGGAALHLTAIAETDFITIDAILIINCYIGVQFTNMAFLTMSNSFVFNAFLAGALIEAPATPDMGDSTIVGCTFECLGGGSARGILHRSGGGWRIIDTKCLGGNISYSLEFTGTTNSSDLFICNCSLEGATTTAIGLARSTGTFALGSIQIVGCELGAPSGITTDSSGVAGQLVISGNNITISGTGAGNVAILLQNVANFTIGPNVLNSAGGSSLGVQTDANCSNGKIAQQTYLGFADANCLSVAAATSVYYERTTQDGTVNLPSASTPYGAALFVATAAVTFPFPYKVTPVVRCTPGNSSAGQVSTFPTSVTKSGFTMVGLTITSSGVMTGNVWAANGIV